MTLRAEDFEHLGDDIMYSPEVLDLVRIGNDYCTLLERTGATTLKEFIVQSLSKLSALYGKMINLSLPDDLPHGVTQKFVNEADWTYIEYNVKERLGSTNRVADLREPSNPGETQSIELSECFADTYQTVKDFISLYELAYEDAARSGLFEFKELFMYHTAPRTLLLMSELHDILYGEEEFGEQTETHKEMGNNTQSDNRWINNFFDDEENNQ